MIRHHLVNHDLPAALGGDLAQQLIEAAADPPAQNPAPILRAPHQIQTQTQTQGTHASRRVAKPAL
jgi:hypothetical protein